MGRISWLRRGAGAAHRHPGGPRLVGSGGPGRWS